MRTTSCDYAAIDSHEEFQQWIQEYIRVAVDSYGFVVTPEWIVNIRTSTRMKREAAKVYCFTLPNAVIGNPINSWDVIDEKYENVRVNKSPFKSLRHCELIVSWNVVNSFSKEEVERLIRHELVHVEQFQLYGKTNHGGEFEKRVTAVDANVSCPVFASYEYVIKCTQCDGFVLGRYNKSKYVKYPNKIQSECCYSPCYTVCKS